MPKKANASKAFNDPVTLLYAAGFMLSVAALLRYLLKASATNCFDVGLDFGQALQQTSDISYSSTWFYCFVLCGCG